MSSKNPEKSLQRSESHLFTSTAKGNKPQAAQAIDEDEALFEAGEFGNSNPVALQRTVWWFLSLHFGFRARDESRKLRWGDVQLQQQNDGQEVLVWLAERGTKTRHGQERGHQRVFQPKIFATNSAVTGQWKWRHQNHRHNRRSNEEVWYMKAPLGKNEIVSVRRSEECWPSQRGEKSNQPFCQENLYFEAPWC